MHVILIVLLLYFIYCAYHLWNDLSEKDAFKASGTAFKG